MEENFLGHIAKKVLGKAAKEGFKLAKKHLGKGTRVTNCKKQESPVWGALKPFKGGYKTDGKYVYRWDNSHRDVEIYDKLTRRELGSLDPVTGKLIRPGNPAKRGQF